MVEAGRDGGAAGTGVPGAAKGRLAAWRPPSSWRRVTTLDAHTGGEPFRIVVTGWPPPRGADPLARRRAATARDDLRRLLMWEPRGHADMYGGLITPPATAGADFGILFLHNEGFSTMCGHGVLAAATVAVETAMVTVAEPETRLVIDTPAGPVTAWVEVAGGRPRRARFHNVPSFVAQLDAVVEVPGLGPVRYDLAYGGAFYAFVDAGDVGLAGTPACYRQLIERGLAIKRAVAAASPPVHPDAADLGFLYGVVFVDRPADAPVGISRHVTVFADGEVDRSPTGTAVSARLAILDARGELADGEAIEVESLVGSRFGGRVVASCRVGEQPAIVPEISGRAFLTGRHDFFLDPEDPLGEGFLLR